MAMELEVLKRDFEALKVLADNQEPRLRYYESRANYMTMGYLMWQRFFYFAVSHPSSALECVHWWMVLGLSLSFSFVYFLIFLEAVIMLYRTHNLLDIICKEQTNICQRISEAINQDDGGSSMEAGDSSDGFGVNFSFSFQDKGPLTSEIKFKNQYDKGTSEEFRSVCRSPVIVVCCNFKLDTMSLLWLAC